MHKGALEPKYRQRPGYHGMLLGGFALLTTAILLIGDLTTHEAIATRAAEDMQQSLAQVIPVALHDNDLLTNTVLIKTDDIRSFPTGEVRVYRALREQQVVAAAFEITGWGYSGAIKLMVGIDRDNKILGVRTIAHAETPGLGDKIETAKSDWIMSFNGLSTDDATQPGWNVKKDGGQFDQFSGATITPRAVVKATKTALAFFAEHRTDIVAANDTIAVH